MSTVRAEVLEVNGDQVQLEVSDAADDTGCHAFLREGEDGKWSAYLADEGEPDMLDGAAEKVWVEAGAREAVADAAAMLGISNIRWL